MIELSHVQPRGLQPSSSETAHETNRSMVLELIRLHGAVSRAELSRITGLQKSTVSIIADHLLSKGWIREFAILQEDSGPGRRPTHLAIDDSLAVIAIDFRPVRTSLAAMDLQGRLLSQETFQTPLERASAESRLLNAASSIIDHNPKLAFQGIGVSLPGRVDATTGRLEFAPNLAWHGWKLKELLSGRLGLPVEMRNAAEAIVLSERWFGAFRGVQDGLVVTVSEGIGVGVLAEGRELQGAHGLAGEFGHIVLDPNGPKCGCGKRGCWETLASNRAVKDAYAAKRDRSLKARRSYLDIVSLAEAGDAFANELIEKQYRQIGEGLKLVLPFVPETLLLAGDFVARWDKFGHIIQECIARHAVPFRAPKLVTTADSTSARLRGATALILQSVYREGLKVATRPSKSQQAHRQGPIGARPVKKSRSSQKQK